MMNPLWKIKWLPEAKEDLHDLDNSVRKHVLRSILKLERDPYEYSNPLGNYPGIKLADFRKLTPAAGYRTVLWILENERMVIIVAVGKREREKAYRTAAKRAADLRKKTEEEMAKLVAMLKTL